MPFSTDALAQSFSIGSAGVGAAAAAPAPPLVSSLTAISKPGFSGFLGAKTACAAKFVTSRTRHVPRIAPMILLSSKESIPIKLPTKNRLYAPFFINRFPPAHHEVLRLD